jgi:hypothetical protein
MSTVQPVFQCRWGFHPCDYSTYRKLKSLNLVYQKAVRLAQAWKRWKRKDPHNRVVRRRLRNKRGQTIGYAPPLPLAEPPLCPVFSHKVFEKSHVDKTGAYRQEGFLEEKVVTEEPWISTDYAAARRPVAHAAEVRPLYHTLAEIDAWYEKARAWLEQQDVG